MADEEKTYRSDDTPLAAHLYAKSHELIGTEQGEWDHTFFIFRRIPELMADIEAYHGDTLVPVKSFWKSYRYLQKLISEARRKGASSNG